MREYVKFITLPFGNELCQKRACKLRGLSVG